MHNVSKKSLKSSKTFSTKLDKKIKSLSKETKSTFSPEKISNKIEIPTNDLIFDKESETVLNKNRKSKKNKINEGSEMKIKQESEYTDVDMKETTKAKNPLKSIPEISAPKDKRFAIVKNINNVTNIDDLLKPITNSKEIVKLSIKKIRTRSVKTSMLTIEFKNTMCAKKVITTLNGKIVDGNTLTAEHKNKSMGTVRTNAGTPSCAFVINNLPITCGKDSIKELLKDQKISTNSIHIVKNKCTMKFDNVEVASAAYAIIKEKIIEGVKPDITFVYEGVELTDELRKLKLRITNLPFTMKKKDVEKEFDMAQSVKLPVTLNNRPNGTCYLSFNTEEEALSAHDALQDKVIGDRKITCEFATVRDPKSNKKSNGEGAKGPVVTLFNLPIGVTDEEISVNFANVKKIQIIKKNQVFKGICQVHFADSEAAKIAMALPDFSLKDRLIRKEWTGPNNTKKVPHKQGKVAKPTNKSVEEEKVEMMET